jgi:hypothetical protein
MFVAVCVARWYEKNSTAIVVLLTTIDDMKLWCVVVRVCLFEIAMKHYRWLNKISDFGILSVVRFWWLHTCM